HLTFFFQAEDGIRDRNVTGVQTCALPIYSDRLFIIESHRIGIGKNKWCDVFTTMLTPNCALANSLCNGFRIGCPAIWAFSIDKRSEERRVGKEGRDQWGEGKAKETERYME